MKSIKTRAEKCKEIFCPRPEGKAAVFGFRSGIRALFERRERECHFFHTSRTKSDGESPLTFAVRISPAGKRRARIASSGIISAFDAS
ncbi:MAG: hypothetical protein BAA03_02980 [Caldibacillus debilis]|nr:MAG: hypothetical protein BAA03_02980 [Caldibacillus debilis]